MLDSKKYIDFIRGGNNARIFILHSLRGSGNAWRFKRQGIPSGESFIVIAGKIPKKFFNEHFYGLSVQSPQAASAQLV